MNNSMVQYIDKSAVVAEIERRKHKLLDNIMFEHDKEWVVRTAHQLNRIIMFLDTLEVKDPYEQCIQYDSIKAGIQAHAETYSFNIESHLFPQLTKEQQALWRKEIEQACISGGDMGYSLAKDPRYKENLEVKEVDFWHKQSEEDIDDAINDWRVYSFLCIMKDGTTQKFTAVMDESYDGSINTHLDCVDDNYDWEYEDIIYWIEIPNIKAQKG